MGINSFSLFPDLHGLSKLIKEKYFYFDDEKLPPRKEAIKRLLKEKRTLSQQSRMRHPRPLLRQNFLQHKVVELVPSSTRVTARQLQSW